MTKVVIIGAGSQFGAKLSRDVLALPALRDCEIALVDIDGAKLDRVHRYVTRIAQANNLPARITATTDRTEALPGASFVVTSISVGGAAYAGFPATAEVEIPRKYGLEQSVADTIGVGGVFRFLRTAPVQLAICRDMERLCSDALLLNYTNPMAMLTWLHAAGSSVAQVGLCHSVQNTIRELSEYLGVPEHEIDFQCAGINHQAWYLRLRRNGEDLYPALRALLGDPATVAKDTVRFSLFDHFGYFVTESTKHCSEYHPYFRRTSELREKYGLSLREVAAAQSLQADHRAWMQDPDNAPLPSLALSNEYAARIIEAMVTDAPYKFYGNVSNAGLIPNLPTGCCVEVACLVDKQGVQPTHPGPLPVALAHLNLTNIAVQELAVRAALDKDREAAFHACALDPLTRAVCSLDQIRAMFDELWQAEAEAGLLF
ncbi:MAG: alpha-galactosidase [Akkermansiaceae bacterium]|nr:alpha-galactosidase [Armatimonadota bacterium]